MTRTWILTNSFFAILLALMACTPIKTEPLNCRFKSVIEKTTFYLSSLSNVQVLTLFSYDANGQLIKLTTNSSSPTRSASYTIDVKNIDQLTKVFSFSYGDGALINDTIKVDAMGRRTQLRQRVRSNGLQNVFDYTYDIAGFNSEITQRDQTNPQINKYRWLVANENLKVYQQQVDGAWKDVITYEYYDDLLNKNYFTGFYHLAQIQGRPSKNVLKKITQGSASLTYTNYLFNKHGYVTGFKENYIASVEQPSSRTVEIDYACF